MMTPSNNRLSGNPELLAPAGSIESFFAALDSGADAVYAGLQGFSARSRARNFTLAEISRMAALCRREGRRLYVALNTLVKERELPEIVEILAALADARVDALIVQDLGLATIVREHFPSLPLHASTQMTIHNIEGVRQMAALGFRRVVLARELSLPEIRAIASVSGTELECFVHGALCFCVSGQCHFSSFLGGRSGNRGDCAQPCRWRYVLEGASEYPFSTRDLWGIDSIQALADAGISCLKIEGRMKPAGYVAAVTTAYRRTIDATPVELADRRREAKVLLAQARGRTGTPGFLVEGLPSPLTDTEIQGVVGQPLGFVESVTKAGFTFTPSERFHSGDRLRVMPGNDRKGRTFTVRGIVTAGLDGTAGKAGTRVTVPTPFRVSPGDAVYRTVDGGSGQLSEAACIRRLESVPAGRISCNVSLDLDGGTLTVTGVTDEFSFEKAFEVGHLDAALGGRVADVLRARFAETADSPFALAGFDRTGFPDRFIPPSKLKEIRRSFYEAFGRAVNGRLDASRQEIRTAALRAVETPRGVPCSGHGKLWIGAGSCGDVALLDAPGIAGFLLPLDQSALRALPDLTMAFSGMADRIVWRLPFWMAGRETAEVTRAVDSLLEAGFRNFEVNNPGHFRILEGKGARMIAGWRMGAMNTQALRSLHAQGAEAVTLSPEDDGDNAEALLRAGLPVARWMQVYGKVQLMVSRIQIPRVEQATALTAEGGDTFVLTTEDGLTVLRSGAPFSVIGRLGRYSAAGCDAFVVELAGTAPEDREAVVMAALADHAFPDSSTFNLDRERSA